MKDFFENSNTANCPISKCSAMNVGCKASSVFKLKNIDISGNKITAISTTTEKGWTEYICLECQAGEGDKIATV